MNPNRSKTYTETKLYNDLLEYLSYFYEDKKTVKDIIKELSIIITSTIKDETSFSQDRIIELIKEYLKKDNKINEHFKDDKEFLIPELFKDELRSNEQTIKKEWNLMPIIYNKSVAESINNIGNQEREQKVKEKIKILYNSKELNIKKYIRKNVSEELKNTLITANLLDFIIASNEEDILELKLDKKINESLKEEIISRKRREQSFCREIKTKEGMNLLIKLVTEMLKQTIYNSLDEYTEKYSELAQDITDEIYMTELFNKNRKQINKKEIIDYIETTEEWQKRIRGRIDDYALFELLEANEQKERSRK